jgi:hypothetical protein
MCTFFPNPKWNEEETRFANTFLAKLLWYLVLTSLVDFIVTEWEVWREQIRLQIETEQTRVLEQWKETTRSESFNRV